MKKEPSLPPEHAEQFISRNALAARWGCCYHTVLRREKTGLLTPVKLSAQSIRYRLSEVLAFERAAAGALPAAESVNGGTL